MNYYSSLIYIAFFKVSFSTRKRHKEDARDLGIIRTFFSKKKKKVQFLHISSAYKKFISDVIIGFKHFLRCYSQKIQFTSLSNYSRKVGRTEEILFF